VAELIADLAVRLGVPHFVAVCADLMAGAERDEYVEELRGLGGHEGAEWKDYWVRTWGARGLLHVWDDSATDAIVRGLADEHWRPAEMSLKVTAKHEVAGTGDGAAALADHELPRVRSQAMRALAVTGDTEHLVVVRDHLDDEDEAVRRQAARALAAMERRLDL
jgi:HEAT repeat protein